MIVFLEYFTVTGKFAGQASYKTRQRDLCEIWAEVREMQTLGTLPTIVGSVDRIVHVNVPDHATRCDRLLIPGQP